MLCKLHNSWRRRLWLENIAHPPVWKQLYGDPGVFVPDQSYPFARDRYYDVETHCVYHIKRTVLQRPVTVDVFGHSHVTQC